MMKGCALSDFLTERINIGVYLAVVQCIGQFTLSLGVQNKKRICTMYPLPDLGDYLNARSCRRWCARQIQRVFT